MPSAQLRHVPVCCLVVLITAGCVQRPDTAATQDGDDSPAPAALTPATVMIAPGAEEAVARLENSPRHGEWAMIPAYGDSVRAWVVYPEQSGKAPVVLVVHEIFGLTHWIRAVADQLAADGFIAIAPDLLTGKIDARDPETLPRDSVVAAVRRLDASTVQKQLDAVARYGMSLPAALPSYGIIGFCWGGSTTFAHAVHAASLGAAVVYYGSSPPLEELDSVRAPVLGLYGADDARVNATIPAADSTLRALGASYNPVIFSGAGHGFLRAQTARDGANMDAARKAWPLTVSWLRENLAGS